MPPKFKNTLGSFKRSLTGFSTILRGSLELKVGLTIFSIVVGVGILEPVINYYRLNGHSSISLGTYKRLLPISYEHPLGTDYFGRDVLALLFTGLKYSLMIGFLAGGVATLIAVTIATMAGYKGGKLDALFGLRENEPNFAGYNFSHFQLALGYSYDKGADPKSEGKTLCRFGQGVRLKRF